MLIRALKLFISTMMRKEANKQIKIKHYIFSPIRILKRAATELLYLKGARNRAASAVQISSHNLEPKSTNLNNNNMSRSANDELPRTVLPMIKNAENETRLITHVGNETRGVNNYMQYSRQRQLRSVQGYKYNRMKMSYRTEVRKMETVDEDKPCCFQEDPSDHSNSNLLYLYPRTRNYGVHRRVVMH